MTDAGARRGGAFFGRRKGKKLRAGQAEPVRNACCPRLRLDPSPGPCRAARLCSAARSTRSGSRSASAAASTCWLAPAPIPDVGIIGCEPFVNGMAKMLAAIEAEGLDNIRLYDGDAGDVIDELPPACLVAGLPALSRSLAQAAAQQAALRLRRRCWRSLARVLRPGGTFCFASDIDHYVGWTLARVSRSPDFDWTARRRGRLAAALCRLAGHTLRGQGISRGPNSKLPGVSALVGRLALRHGSLDQSRFSESVVEFRLSRSRRNRNIRSDVAIVSAS